MTTTTEIRVRYVETDAQGIVHHSNYLVWFEEGRSEHLRQCGLNYTDFEKAGYFIVVVDAQVQYKAPAYYEDLVRIETGIETNNGKLIRFSYRALNAQGTLLAQGSTTHLVLGKDRRPTRLPEEFVAPLREEGTSL